ncbi:50S ribosomal protein P1 [Vulcanisaeta thermophila]|uniref:50S ribosomal protein P1 n=1 Tax=Vulcanisaeta thermophila TaxID=867917 RepID=UPI000852D24B|nr:50S ribosomal protein P1 [Vulcanisaeta thermophila]
MEYVYAALLLHYGKQQITEENIMKVLQAAGIQVDEVKVKALVAAIKEVNIDEAIKSAAVVPVAAAAAPQAAATQAAPSGGEAKAEAKGGEEKKAEEKKEGPSEEEIAAGLASLFG